MNKELPKRRNGYYYLEGEKAYVSVTTVLGAIAKPWLAAWAARESARAALADPTLDEKEAASAMYKKRDAAGERGRTVHSFAEAYKQGAKINLETMPEQFRGYAKAFVSFVEEFKPEFILKEKTVFSDKYQFAGTLDILCKMINGKNKLIDVKTSKGVYPENGLQLVAYKVAVEEMGLAEVDSMAVLQLKEDGTFALVEMDQPFDIFLAVKELWLWMNSDRHKTSKPRKRKVK